jgi:hypothetical protein
MPDVQAVTRKLVNIQAARRAVVAAALDAATVNAPTPPPATPAGPSLQEGTNNGNRSGTGR